MLTTFSNGSGSVIDTRALFDLLWLVDNNPTLKPAARALLKAGAPLVERVPDSALAANAEPTNRSEADAGNG